MRTHLAGLAVLLVVADTSAAHAAKPAWCKSAGDASLNVYGSLEDVFKEDDPRDALYTLVAASCFPDSDAQAAASRLEAARKEWSQKLHLTEADWADVAEWATRSQGERNSPTIYPSDPKLAWSKYTPVDQYGGIINSQTGDSSRVADPAYVADALGERLGQAGRLGYITVCLGSRAQPVEWAMCQPDLDAFDAKQLSDELRGDTTHDGFQRTTVRIEGFLIAPKLAERAAAVKALVDKDPAYGKLFTIAKEQRQAWLKVDPSYVALMSGIDDARVTGSRRAAEGCAERTWSAWKTVVASIPAERFGKIQGEPGNSFLEQAAALIVGTPHGYLASLALHLCGSLDEKPDYLIRSLGGAMSRWPGYRGPRTATHTAILTAGIELDDRDAQLEYPDVSRPWIHGSSGSSGGGTGVIAGLKSSGATATIEFAKVKSTQKECTKGRRTNRITQIRSDGGIVYEYICEATRTVTINEPPAPPQTVKARYAEGLKKGQLVAIAEDVVTVAYPKSDAGKPAMVAGVPVK